jgi:hypothetical protein
MQEAQLRLLEGGNVNSSLIELKGRSGVGIHRLDMALNWSPTSWDLLHDARVMFGGDLEIGFGGGMRHPLGQLQAVYPVAFPSPTQGTFPARVDLGTNIVPAQLEALERSRDGGPVTLLLKLRGMVFKVPSDAGNPPPEAFWGELQYEIKAAEWMEVLEGWTYAQAFLLQVPKFASEGTPAAAKASKGLEKAISDMAEGRYREAVAACRDVMEAAFGANDKNRHPKLEYRVTGMADATKEERFWLARRGAWAIANAAKHQDETTQDIEWHRRDAQAMILILSALLEQGPPE